MSEITPRTTTKGRFRFDMPVQDALDMLAAAYRFEVERRQRRFILDANTESCLVSLAVYITQATPMFGIICSGSCGNGKTTLLYAFQRVVNHLEDRKHFSFLNGENRPFKASMEIFRAKELAMYSKDLKRFNEIKSRPMLAIDDLGTEPAEVHDYLNINTPVVDLIDYRYNHQLFTFITTNLVGKDIRNKYKDRTADRFNEMFHKIAFKGDTYRKQQ